MYFKTSKRDSKCVDLPVGSSAYVPISHTCLIPSLHAWPSSQRVQVSGQKVSLQTA